MFEVVLLFVFFGCAAGIFTGFTPGIHVNLVAVVMASTFSGLGMRGAVFAVAMGMTHSVVSVLPNVFLGYPGEGTELNLLPAHRLVGEGRGVEAVYVNVFGSVVAGLIGALYFPWLTWFFGAVYGFIEVFMAELLVAACVYVAFRKKPLMGVAVFLCAGFLGVSVLRSSLPQPFYALLTGLFGVPGIVESLRGYEVFPEQRDVDVVLDDGVVGGAMKGCVAGGCTGVLPGLGSSVAASFVSGSESNPSVFLGVTGAITTANFFFSLATFEALEKARNGVVVVASEMWEGFGADVMLMTCVVGAGMGVLVTCFCARRLAWFMRRVPYRVVASCILAVLLVLCLVLCGWRGVLVCFFGSVLGWTCIQHGVPRTALLGCLLVPVTTFFVGL